MAGQKAQDALRAERLAAELRANLKKRKARSRAQQAGDEAVKPDLVDESDARRPEAAKDDDPQG